VNADALSRRPCRAERCVATSASVVEQAKDTIVALWDENLEASVSDAVPLSAENTGSDVTDIRCGWKRRNRQIYAQTRRLGVVKTGAACCPAGRLGQQGGRSLVVRNNGEASMGAGRYLQQHNEGAVASVESSLPA